MQQYRAQISEYLSHHRPDVWSQMTSTEVDALADQITQAVIEEMEQDPTPQPSSSDHAALVAHHAQVRRRAEELVLEEMLYQPFPPTDDDQVDETAADAHQILREIIEARNELDQP